MKTELSDKAKADLVRAAQTAGQTPANQFWGDVAKLQEERDKRITPRRVKK